MAGSMVAFISRLTNYGQHQDSGINKEGDQGMLTFVLKKGALGYPILAVKIRIYTVVNSFTLLSRNS
jgi:hypothetical protein